MSDKRPDPKPQRPERGWLDDVRDRLAELFDAVWNPPLPVPVPVRRRR